MTTDEDSFFYDGATFDYLRLHFSSPISRHGESGQVSSNTSISRSITLCQVTEWLTRAFDLTALDYKSLEKLLAELENHLTLRSYIVGYSLTLADLVVCGGSSGKQSLDVYDQASWKNCLPVVLIH